jgi:hypothetical protein
VLRGRTSRGRPLAIALFALVAAAFGVAGTAIGADRTARTVVTAETRLLETRQDEILDAGSLPVSVKADDAVTVKLRGRSRIGADEAKVAKTRIFELEPGEKLRVELPLTSEGRARLTRCDAQQLLIKMRVSPFDDPIGDPDDGRAQITEQLVPDEAACPPARGA